MGWTFLYIAFGVVALWLLGEVLLQYKARLRWRLLAFSGFLLVVLGVLLPSVLVIVVGALAFAVGQIYVTLSYRRGFSTGWALGGSPGASRRRRSGPPADRGARLEVTELAYEPAEPARDEGPEVYETEPLPDDTGQYGVYDTSYDQGQGQPQPQGYGYDGYQPGYDQTAGYDYGAGVPQQQYAAYSDPYIAGPGADQQYAAYDYGQQGQQGQYGQPDPYAPSYTYDTPPGGVWVPQQRDGEQPPYPQEPPQQYGYYDEGQQQYRY